MKKSIVLVLILICMLALIGCSNASVNSPESEEIASGTTSEEIVSEEAETNSTVIEAKTTVSGSFTVSVRDVIPDYCLDDFTPSVAVVTEFQSYPFTLPVGEEIGKQLEIGEAYVFTIEPVVVDYPKEYLEEWSLSSLVWDLPGFKITDFRLANSDELGLASRQLTIE